MFLEQLINGLTLGCMYALIALGYTLVFGVIRVIFFAQGELSMISAFIGIGTLSLFGGSGNVGGLSYAMILVVFLFSALGTTVVGVIGERIALRPIREAPRTTQLITSLGLSIVLQNIVFLAISSGNIAFPPFVPSKSFNFGPMTINSIQVFIILLSIVLMISLDSFVRKTRLGLAMRASAESHKLSKLTGININRTITITFIVGSCLASVAGIMMGLYDGVAKYDMGFMPGIKAFTAAILGGIGNVRGGMLGGILIGLIESLGAGYVSADYKDLFSFLILIGILVARPSGLLGEQISKTD